MSDVELRIAWQKADPILRRDAEAVWDALNAVYPREREDRLKELVAVAYDGEQAVGACTARLIDYKVLRARVFYLRPTILPGPRHDEILIRLLSSAKSVLQPWALAHPGERLKGVLVMFDSDAFDALYSEPILRRLDVELPLTGYTDEGRQIRMLWFDDARLEK
jgi:hypothetical protein